MKILEQRCYWCGKNLEKNETCNCIKNQEYLKEHLKNSFEEKFPSLNNCEVISHEGMDFKAVAEAIRDKNISFFPYKKEFYWLKKEDIQQNCIDKQKVRDAIDKIINNCPKSFADGGRTIESSYADGYAIAIGLLKKELGL